MPSKMEMSFRKKKHNGEISLVVYMRVFRGEQTF